MKIKNKERKQKINKKSDKTNDIYRDTAEFFRKYFLAFLPHLSYEFIYIFSVVYFRNVVV